MGIGALQANVYRFLKPPLPDPPPDAASLVSKVTGVLDRVSLNPQPLPPGPDPSALKNSFSKLDLVALNPQPLPPGPDPQSLMNLSLRNLVG